MGKSNKPDIDYRVHTHIQYVETFIQKLELKDMILVIHDWGSAIGFHYAKQNEKNVRGIVFMESIWRTMSWKEMSLIEKVLPMFVVRKLSEKEMDQYRNVKDVYLGKGKHNLQEDHPDKIGSAIAEWFQSLG